jgi:ABC-type multidrug transport system ATPase subunit
VQGGLKTRNVKVLKNMNGKLRPGSITLLLGPPGSGKSVFMQALSGRLQTGDGTRVRACGRADRHACLWMSVHRSSGLLLPLLLAVACQFCPPVCLRSQLC